MLSVGEVKKMTDRKYIAVLDGEDGRVYMVEREGDDIEECLLSNGFSLQNIQWMLCKEKEIIWKGV